MKTALFLLLVLLATPVLALDREISGLLSDAAQDVATIGGLVLMIFISIAAFKFMRRAVTGEPQNTWVDNKGNEYYTRADAEEAEARADKKDPDWWRDDPF